LAKVGLFMTVYGEEPEMTKDALTSLVMTLDHPTEILVHATQPGKKTYDLLCEWRDAHRIKDYIWMEGVCGLQRAFNHCRDYFLADPEICYIGSIHNDMTFPRPWISALVARLEADPLIGKLSPINLRDGDVGSQNGIERAGNECPWIAPVEACKVIGPFDENYGGGGEVGDWDHNRALMTAGYKVLITPDAQIMHPAMQTRFKYHTTPAESGFQNREYYFKKWGTHDAPC
jgi:hypothetical protein